MKGKGKPKRQVKKPKQEKAASPPKTSKKTKRQSAPIVSHHKVGIPKGVAGRPSEVQVHGAQKIERKPVEIVGGGERAPGKPQILRQHDTL